MALQLGDTAPDFTAETTVSTLHHCAGLVKRGRAVAISWGLEGSQAIPTRGAATTLDDNICTSHVHKHMENVS